MIDSGSVPVLVTSKVWMFFEAMQFKNNHDEFLLADNIVDLVPVGGNNTTVKWQPC